MGFSVELPQLGLRHTTSLASTEARNKRLGADANLESVTNRAPPTLVNHYERRSSATAMSDARSPSPGAPVDAASEALARASQRLLDALPRIETTLEGPVEPAQHLDFRNDFLQVAVAVEDFMDLVTEGARNGTLPGPLADEFSALASNRRVVADGETMPQLWDRMGLGIGGDYTFLQSKTARAELLDYCSQVRQAISDYGYATGNDQLAWAFEVPLAVPGEPAQPGRPALVRNPSYRIAVSGSLVDPPVAEPAQDRQHAAKTGKGLLERLQSVGHSIVERLRSMFVGIGNVKDRFFHGTPGAGLVSRLEADGVDHADGSALDTPPTLIKVIRDYLLPALPRIEHLLQADISHNAYREFHADLHGIQRGMEAIATLAEQGVRAGALSPEVSETIESLVDGSAVVADGQTLMQVWERIRVGDYTFLESPRVREDLARFIAKTRDAAVDFADSIGNPRFARELEASWLEGAAP